MPREKAKLTNARPRVPMRRCRGGSTGISVEGSVMEPERSGRIMGSSSCANPTGDERAVPVKPFDIPKRLVVQAWRLVRANRGAPGVDEESLELFERDLKRNLYRIWNRMSSGSYLPAPVKEVLIPKKSGGQRQIGRA